MAGFAFQTFPQRQKRFRLRLYDGRQIFIGEIVVPNLAPRGAANWETESLPIPKRDGDLAFTLHSLSLHTPNNSTGSETRRLQAPPLIAPVFQVSEDGRLTTEWEAVQMDLSDSWGNRPSQW